MNVQELESELRAGTLRGTYIIVGEEAYMAAQAVAGILQHVEKQCGEKPIQSQFEGKGVGRAELFDVLQSLSLLGGWRVVVVRDAAKLKKEIQEDIVDYLLKPAPSTTLILQATKFDGRSRLMVAANKQGGVVECKPLYANQVPSWIAALARRQGKQISLEAARYMADLVGNDTAQIAGALERLILYLGEKNLIDVADIEKALAETSQRTIFELTDALGRRTLPRAVAILSNILDHGEAPVMVLSMIARHLRILVKAKELEGASGGDAEAARHLGVHPFFAKEYRAQAKAFSLPELKNGFRLCAGCDRELKSSRLDRGIILERLVMEFCIGGRHAALR